MFFLSVSFQSGKKITQNFPSKRLNGQNRRPLKWSLTVLFGPNQFPSIAPISGTHLPPTPRLGARCTECEMRMKDSRRAATRRRPLLSLLLKKTRVQLSRLSFFSLSLHFFDLFLLFINLLFLIYGHLFCNFCSFYYVYFILVISIKMSC